MARGGPRREGTRVILGAFGEVVWRKSGSPNSAEVWKTLGRLKGLPNGKTDLKVVVWKKSAVWKTVILEI